MSLIPLIPTPIVTQPSKADTPARDYLDDDEGNDYLYGTSGNDLLDGGGNDYLCGGLKGDDMLIGRSIHLDLIHQYHY